MKKLTMISYLFVVLLCIISLDVKITYAESDNANNSGVLTDAVERNGHYYKIFNMPMKWEDANKQCVSMGGHLATAETKEENEFIKEFFVSTVESNQDVWCWLGGVRDKKGIWHWVTGKMMTDYYDWVGGKPRENLQLGGSYLCLWKRKDGKWDNHGKMSKCLFMCEWESADKAHDSAL